MVKFLQVWILPPGANLLLGLCGLFMLRRYPRTGVAVFVITLSSLWFLSTPFAANLLINQLQVPFQKLEQNQRPQAIVVLGGGVVPAHKALGNEPDLSSASWLRLRAAVKLHRKTQLPLLLSGGGSKHTHHASAQLMAQALNQDFHEQARWIEPDSLNTQQNAEYTAKYLKRNKIQRVYLVTSAWHLPRALRSFESQGLKAIPYPAHYSLAAKNNPLLNFLPDSYALHLSELALHEIIGMAWYQQYYWSS